MPHVSSQGQRRRTAWVRAAAIASLTPLGWGGAFAEEPTGGDDKVWAIHAQATLTEQGTFAFASPYRGEHSLDPGTRGRETFDLTVYAGLKLWRGAEIWINPEIDQGFGLNGTLGAAGFPSGEAYKVGQAEPYYRLQRLFVRQTFDLGGASRTIDAQANQFGGETTRDRLVVTVGKLGLPDVFDVNDYAHDPRRDFLNWSLIDSGAFDYASDAWGYSIGAAAEWYVGDWSLRGGLFDLSDVPNSNHLDSRFRQLQGVIEGERRFEFLGRPGKLAITGFLSRGRMGSFIDALAARRPGGPADVAAVRRYRTRDGVSFNLQQEIAPQLGLFIRGGFADGAVEPYDFADIDQTLAAGLSINGARWGRGGDTIGVAAVVNQISQAHQAYLDAGGLGILIGDGRLPHPGSEAILETYYDLPVRSSAHVALDYQLIDHPAYNKDRGPASILAVRLHGQF